MSLLSKFTRFVRNEGLVKSVKRSYAYLTFMLKINFTKLKLNLLKLIARPPIIIKHGNHRLYFNADGDYEEILYHAHWKMYFRKENEKIGLYVNDGDSVMDIGANLGLFTILLSSLIGPNGNLYSFEPVANTFSKLNANIRLNNINNVECFALGMGEVEDNVRIFSNPNQSGLSSIVEKDDGGCISQDISITTLDKFTRDIKEKISFIKIDTEGYESNVLKGGINLIKRDKPVIYLEIGGLYYESSMSALTLLKRLNYKCQAHNLDIRKIPPGTNFIAIYDDGKL